MRQQHQQLVSPFGAARILTCVRRSDEANLYLTHKLKGFVDSTRRFVQRKLIPHWRDFKSPLWFDLADLQRSHQKSMFLAGAIVAAGHVTLEGQRIAGGTLSEASSALVTIVKRRMRTIGSPVHLHCAHIRNC